MIKNLTQSFFFFFLQLPIPKLIETKLLSSTVHCLPLHPFTEPKSKVQIFLMGMRLRWWYRRWSQEVWEEKQQYPHTNILSSHGSLSLSLSLSLFLFALVVLLVETVCTSKRICKKENIEQKIFCDEEKKKKKKEKEKERKNWMECSEEQRKKRDKKKEKWRIKEKKKKKKGEWPVGERRKVT